MTTTFACPKGDQSDDPEFCSVCGIKIDPTATSATAPASATTTERCPTCGMQRTPGARFCETCRYDFKSQAAGPPPTVTASAPDPTVPPPADPAAAQSADPVAAPSGDPAAASTSTPSPPPAPLSTAGVVWEAVVAVDPSLDVDPDPSTPCPTDAPERTFPLDLRENLVGRRSAARGIFPQIALDDPGVSHRHLMVYRNQDGSLVVSDLGSTNGTYLNDGDAPLEPGVKTPVAENDHVQIGRWTRITFHQRA